MKQKEYPNLLKEPPVETRRKAGIKSGETRRRKKELKEIVKYLIDLPVRDGDTEEIKTLVEAKNKNLTVIESMILAQIKKALTGDTRAFNSLIEAGGEKPAKKHEITLNEEAEMVAEKFNEIVKKKTNKYEIR